MNPVWIAVIWFCVVAVIGWFLRPRPPKKMKKVATIPIGQMTLETTMPKAMGSLQAGMEDVQRAQQQQNLSRYDALDLITGINPHAMLYTDPDFYSSRAMNPAGYRDKVAKEMQDKMDAKTTQPKLSMMQQIILVITAIVIAYKLYQHRAEIGSFLTGLGTKVSKKLGLD